MDVRELLCRAVDQYADRTALVADGRRYTFAEAWSRGVRLANALLDLGLLPGDRVGVLEDNSIEAADFYLAATIAGLIRVPLYARNARASHEYMLDHTGCVALLVAANHAAEVHRIRAAVPRLKHVIVRDAGYEDWVAAYPDSEPGVPISAEDWLLVRHTGGTTGRPKGVAYTHQSWIASFRDWFYRMPALLPGGAFMHYGPISHGSGYCFLPAWIAGASNVLESRFDPATVLHALVEHRVTHTVLVPTMLNLIVRHPHSRGRTFPDLACVITGTAPISEETLLAAREIFGDVLYQVYAQTEATPIAIMGPDEWFACGPGAPRLRAAGRPAPFTRVRISDPVTHETLPTGAEGEIVVQCAGQMTGYWDDPEATRAQLVDGWVLTGDIGCLDEDGFLHVLDRQDDLIISGGFNIWPVELENVIAGHPSVMEVAVFGVPDATWGEAPYAVVRAASDARVSADEIIAMCAERLGSYKKPRQVEFTTAPLPRSPVGKLLRRQLREPHWLGRNRRVSGG